MKKFIPIFLCLCLLILSFTSCEEKYIVNNLPDDNQNNTSISLSNQQINIPYYSNDSLNPFFATTNANRVLMSLCYENLFNIDSSFSATPSVSSSYKVDSDKITVKIDMNTVFSDGIQISSQDVIYSFNMAKKSAYYIDELTFITGVKYVDDSTCIFQTSGNAINSVDSLVFPIVKNNTASSATSLPIGTGCFKFEKDSTTLRAVRNSYCRKLSQNISQINFVNVKEDSTFIHLFELGQIDAYFDDLSSGSYSTASAVTSKTILPNLVFMGMNSSSFGLRDAAVRQAMYYSVNRHSIARNSFKNLATPSPTVFPPSFHIKSESENTDDYNMNLDKAVEKLKAAGITGKLNYTMIVNSSNSFKVSCAKEIVESLKTIDVNVTLRELTFKEYKEALENGQYDLYIGEVKIPTNMNMTSLFSSSTAIKGIKSSDTTMNSYTQFLNGKITLDQMNESFMTNMPFVPICYRTGVLIYSNKITPSPNVEYLNYFKNIYQWEIISDEENQTEEF